ncbi:putative protein FAM10A4 [Condylostylus longicornis]|uniref:putative protein FAM10A4 n=1 Tax=Condylostylus longicornis TaxID=2530218 RepID=UPI00244DF34E|nr:putative protein FAM10A4 [Condylostylus longicornis]
MDFGEKNLEALKTFIAVCSTNPQILNTPKLSFFKQFVESLGGKIPAGESKMPTFESSEKPSPTSKAPDSEPKVEEEDSEKESDVELDMDGVIEPDTDDPQEMGDKNKEVTEEEIDQASDLRSQAASAYSEQKFEEAIDLYTKAININPGNALFHAKRGQAYLKLKKPNACIRDCDRALELNCDSAAAYKYRGRANRLLGNWEAAAKDLRQACKLDYDEEADEWLKEVTPNAKKIEQHRIKWDRIKTEKEIKKRQERVRTAQEANKKAQEEEESRRQGGGMPSGFRPEDMPAGMDFSNMFNTDEEHVKKLLSDPEVKEALNDIGKNPANLSKYLSNPKFLNLACLLGGDLKSKMGGGGSSETGGFPGFPGGAFPGAENPPNNPPPPQSKPYKPDFSDDGLD